MDTERCSRCDVTEYAVQRGKYVRIVKKETKLWYGRHKEMCCKMLFLLLNYYKIVWDCILLLLLFSSSSILNAFFTYRSMQYCSCTDLIVGVINLLWCTAATITGHPIGLTTFSNLVWPFFRTVLMPLRIVLCRSVCLNRHSDTGNFVGFNSQW